MASCVQFHTLCLTKFCYMSIECVIEEKINPQYNITYIHNRMPINVLCTTRAHKVCFWRSRARQSAWRCQTSSTIDLCAFLQYNTQWALLKMHLLASKHCVKHVVHSSLNSFKSLGDSWKGSISIFTQKLVLSCFVFVATVQYNQVDTMWHYNGHIFIIDAHQSKLMATC